MFKKLIKKIYRHKENITIKEMLEILGKKEQPKTPTFQSQIIQLIQQINVQSLIQNSKKKQKFHPFQQNTDTGRL